MSYRNYAYGTQELGNATGDVRNFLPTDLKIDPASTSQTLIIMLSNLKGVVEGTFSYNMIKATFADIVSSKFSKITVYDNDVLQQIEYLNPPEDGLTYFFGSYQQILPRYKGDDEFVGSLNHNGDDQVRGYTGNDRYTGYGDGEYSDYFNGESGFDIAFLRGKSSEYSILASSIYDIIKDDGSQTPGFIVQDLVNNRDGKDHYNNVERLYFSDKVVALDLDGNAGQAYRLYQATLDRTPDENGLAGWIKFMDDGGSLVSMAQQFIDSTEFKTKYGSLNDRNFVNQLYLNVLDRNGEAAGIDGWVNGLANGLSRSQVLIGFSESGENQNNVLGQIQNGIPYAEWWLA